MLRRRDPAREAGRLLTEIYRTHVAGAYRYAYHLTRSREDADDIVQAVFLGLHQALLRGDTIVSPGAFLATAVKRRAINLAVRRRDEPDAAAVEQMPAPSAGADAAAELRRIQTLLYTLPEAQHQAFVLRHWSGLSNREIAAVLDTTEPAVESLLVRARSALMAAAAPDQQCAEVCARLAEARPTRPADAAHISGCRGCRTAEQRLSRAADIAAAAVLLPNAHVAHALASAVPGFSAGAAVGTSSGTMAAAAGSKASSAVILAKTGAAIVAVTAVTAAGIHAHPWARRAVRPAGAAVAHTHRAAPSAHAPASATAFATPAPAQGADARTGTGGTPAAQHEAAAARHHGDGRDAGAAAGGDSGSGSGDSGSSGGDSSSGSGDSGSSGGDSGSSGGGSSSNSGDSGSNSGDSSSNGGDSGSSGGDANRSSQQSGDGSSGGSSGGSGSGDAGSSQD